jgi:hypothetical protein
VDDMTIVDNNVKLRERILGLMREKFDVDYLGPARWILGMNIDRDEAGSYILHQTKYINDILAEYGMQECNSAKEPMVIDNSDDTSEPCDKGEYLKLLGKLSYLAVMTRPDISFAVNRLAQQSMAPTEKCWIALKRVLRYVAGTTHYHLVYSPSGNDTVVGYSDADWAGCVDTRKSTSGYVFTLGGAAVSWRSNKQPVVALSSTEAEYIAGTLATQEAMFLRFLFRDLGLPMQAPTSISIDNRGAIALGKNFISNKRTKHIDIRFHFIREKVRDGVITLHPIATKDMPADCLTKPLGSQKFLQNRSLLFGM